MGDERVLRRAERGASADERVGRRRPGLGCRAVRGRDGRTAGFGRTLAAHQRPRRQVLRLLRHPGRGPRRGVPVARQGTVRPEPARRRPRLRRADPVPRRADPLARQPRGRPQVRAPGRAEAGEAGRGPDAGPADPHHQLRGPSAGPARADRRRRAGRRAAQLRRRPEALGRAVPHHHPGRPQPAGHRREAGAQGQERGGAAGAGRGLRADRRSGRR